MQFSAEALFDLLKGFPTPSRYWIAYSGGRDSHVLLHAMSTLVGRLSAPLHAVHVNHGLQQASDEWDLHCQQVCASLTIPLVTRQLGLTPVKGESLEAVARNARHQVFIEQMDEGDMLLTAHHQDDQAETLLIQLLRGAGPGGLGAMPLYDRFGQGHRCRPLLSFSRDQLTSYARAHELLWVEDESNSDTSFDRNYLRKEIFPRLQARWPGVASTFSRSARHCAESHNLIEVEAAEDLKVVMDSTRSTLNIDRLRGFSPPRLRALLRYWISSSGFALPSTARLNRIISEVIPANRDRSPLVDWQGAEVRRYRNGLYLLAPTSEIKRDEVMRVVAGDSWQLPSGLGEYRLDKGTGGIDPEKLSGAKLDVRFYPGSKRLRISGRGHSTTFKNYYQEQGVPPWQRGRLPLLYADGELVAVADLCICEPFAVSTGESGLIPVWVIAQGGALLQ